MAYNNTLPDVLVTRQTKNVWESISPSIDPTPCLVAVPYGFQHLIGKEVWLQSDKMYGPMLVVDVESINHKGQMFNRRLMADTNCKHLVHKKGLLYARREYYEPFIQKSAYLWKHRNF